MPIPITFNFTQHGGALAGLGIFGGNTQLAAATGGLLGNGGRVQENFSGYFASSGGFGGLGGIVDRTIGAIGNIFGQVATDPPFTQGRGDFPYPGPAEQLPTFVGGVRSNTRCWIAPDDPRLTGDECHDRMVLQRAYARRRVRMVRVPDNTPQRWHWEMIQTCAPRRMNPLNPKALARAGRRVGSFCRIASGMQKMLEKAIRKGGGSSRRRSYSCSPKRCR